MLADLRSLQKAVGLPADGHGPELSRLVRVLLYQEGDNSTHAAEALLLLLRECNRQEIDLQRAVMRRVGEERQPEEPPSDGPRHVEEVAWDIEGDVPRLVPLERTGPLDGARRETDPDTGAWPSCPRCGVALSRWVGSGRFFCGLCSPSPSERPLDESVPNACANCGALVPVGVTLCRACGDVRCDPLLRFEADATWEEPRPAFDLITHLHRQRAFSLDTFGPGLRTAGVLDHIRKELRELEAEPTDLSEWIDVVLLALDGAWRHGHEPEAIAAALAAKQARNEARDWPDWQTMPADCAIEHVRRPADCTPGEDATGAEAHERASRLANDLLAALAERRGRDPEAPDAVVLAADPTPDAETMRRAIDEAYLAEQSRCEVMGLEGQPGAETVRQEVAQHETDPVIRRGKDSLRRREVTWRQLLHSDPLLCGCQSWPRSHAGHSPPHAVHHCDCPQRPGGRAAGHALPPGHCLIHVPCYCKNWSRDGRTPDVNGHHPRCRWVDAAAADFTPTDAMEAARFEAEAAEAERLETLP